MLDTKDPLSVSEAEFAQFQNRAFKYESYGFPEADPECIPLIKALNRTKDITPVFSCAGHPEENKLVRFYMLMACLPTGRKRLEHLFSQVADRLNVGERPRFVLLYKNMLNPDREIVLEGKKITYPAVIIEYYFKNQRQQSTFLSTVMEILSTLLDNKS